ncbi:hypothetical protein [Oricola nitratireducens]|uniref:hypothetical protein n=1 Tax=Oricola nitratireducens TaxID=2775868 RepID=UPI001865BB79|nr:hypothetical protein [Oricola nitratireducens]
MKLFRTAVFSVPLIGWLLRSAWNGDAREKVFFILNLLLLWAMAFLQFGYPALIVPAVTIAFAYLAFLVFFTAGDFLAGGGE